MPDVIGVNLTGGAIVTMTVTSQNFQPGMLIFPPFPPPFLLYSICSSPFPLTADTTHYKADTTGLKADATELTSDEVATVTFTVPLNQTGLWRVEIVACDGGCGTYNFTSECP